MLHRGTVALCLLLVCQPLLAVATNDDHTFFLREQTQRAVERRALPPDSLIAPPGAVVHDNTIYEVQTTLESLEPAIYIALNTGQWDRLLEFISRYRLLRDHRAALVDMALGLLARQQGDHARALHRMQAAHTAAPEDIRIRLELARLQFEDNRDAEARANFESARRGELPDYGRRLAQQYLAALDARARWHGSLAVGMGYNSNINHANGDRSCLAVFMDICVVERNMADPISSALMGYEAVLERRYNLTGNHNLLVQPISYGSYYRRNGLVGITDVRNYSGASSMLYLGYQYLSARTSVSLLPYAEHYYRDGRSNYLSGGMQMEWRRMIAAKWHAGASLDARRYHHKQAARGIASDYSQYRSSLFASYVPRRATSIYGGLDLVRKKYEVEQASSRDLAMRMGISHAFETSAGLYLNAMGIFRLSQNDAYDGFLGGRRRDKQQVYIVSLCAKGWNIAGLTPELRVRHSANRSNLGWAFDFRQNEMTLLLRRTF
ncbi:porin family protein [Allopusillimonas ginsengisoli]|uniref:porin family protein n=1 Tax=Allopusillimonas ginsengisoli TaxID=453575 RepID=UPI0010229341|nr:porin family protein [Allopusillimonas ginsengisoli]TEA74118.1 DUF560 domain-containing protein [Allopusillimonas ginsengisoli]